MSVKDVSPDRCCWARCRDPVFLTYAPDGGDRVSLCGAHWARLAAAESIDEQAETMRTHLGLGKSRIHAWVQRQKGNSESFLPS